MAIFKKNDEKKLTKVNFNIHKFTNRPRPTSDRVLFICCFSEFGCEVVGAMYCVPRVKEENPDFYYIVVGWYGRAYLYKHLVDEFWEIQEEYQWLREKSLAFHHCSKNLLAIEKSLNKFGKVVKSDLLGRMAVGNICNACQNFWGQTEKVIACKCGSKDITRSLFSDIPYWKPKAVPIPKPSKDKLEIASQYLGENPVGIIGRNRKTYGRNLPPEFYVKLIKLLRSMGYTPIWLGEKQTSLECPVNDIVDMTKEARDLELTLAIVSKLNFTIQFWTASTRLSAIMEVPYLIFESPDQLFGNGQEAYRMALCTTGKKKIVLSHFLNVYNNHDAALKIVRNAVEEMKKGNWQDIIGLVNEPLIVTKVRDQNIYRLAGI